MRWEEQGITGQNRYAVIPRTLCFLIRGDSVLLLRGAPTKRIWPNKLNGIGGHVEPNEDVWSSVRREIREETGLNVEHLHLAGIIHIEGIPPAPGVLITAFVAPIDSTDITPSQEGQLEWHRLSSLPKTDLVEDLPELIPRLLASMRRGHILYGHYRANEKGEMLFSFKEHPQLAPTALDDKIEPDAL